MTDIKKEEKLNCKPIDNPNTHVWSKVRCPIGTPCNCGELKRENGIDYGVFKWWDDKAKSHHDLMLKVMN